MVGTPSLTPSVSVLLPVWNGAATLPAALDSLAAQTLPDWEAVVVDDGSTDGTWPLLRERARHDARIRPLRLPHGGIVAALNAGLVVARGRYVARLDADDTAHPERLARQAAWLDAHPETGLVSCRVAFGGDPERAAGFARIVDWMNACLSREDIRLQRFRETPLPHPSVMFRRDLPARYGGYADGPFPEDWELWLRWLDAGVIMDKLPQVLLTWNDPPGRLTRTHDNYAEAAFTRARIPWLARHLARANPQHPQVWVVGGGRVARRRALPLREQGVRIRAWVDIDPRKIGNTVHGIPVVGRSALPPAGQCFVLIFLTAHGAAEEAARWLESGGFVAGRDYLMAS